LDCGIQKTKKEKMRVKGPRFKEKGQRTGSSVQWKNEFKKLLRELAQAG
jgi:hypothetical protein